MGPATYALCQKALIGPAMWITGLCAFPSLIAGESIELGVAGASVTKSFRAPVERNYPLSVTFEFPSAEARLGDQIVGDRYSDKCQGNVRYEEIPQTQREGLGRPIPFRVVIKKSVDRSVVLDRIFVSLCLTSSNGRNAKTRTIGWLPLAVGDYVAEITNLEAQTSLPGVKTAISLDGGHGK